MDEEKGEERVWFWRATPATPSTIIKVLTIFLMISATFFCAGVIIGYSQLYPVLTSSGVLHEKYCHNSNYSEVCPKQKAALDNMFLIGSSISIFVQAPSGLFLDTLGPKITALLGIILMIPGSILFAFATSSFEVHVPAFQFLAAGGPFIFLSSITCTVLFPKYAGVLMLALNGAYGGGALVFYVFEQFFDQFGWSLKTLFFYYTVILLCVAAAVLVFWPWRPYQNVGDNSSSHSHGTSGKGAKSRTGSEYFKNILRCVLTLDYLYLFIYVSILVAKSNFYLASIESQLQELNGGKKSDDDVDTYLNAFGLILPGVGLAAAPLGLIVDKLGVPAAVASVIFLSGVSTVIGIIHIMPLQYVRFVVFSMFFPMVYGTWGSFIIQRYGIENYGTLYGILAVGVGAVNFVGNPINDWSLEHGYLWPNIWFLIASSSLLVWPLLVTVSGSWNRNIKKKSMEDAQDAGHDTLLINDDDGYTKTSPNYTQGETGFYNSNDPFLRQIKERDTERTRSFT